MLKQIWQWYWFERSSLLLFPKIRGARRLVFEIPLLFISGCALYYAYMNFWPGMAREKFVAIYTTPFGIMGILGILAHEVGVSYMKDQIQFKDNFATRLHIAMPGTALVLFKQQYAGNPLIKVLRIIRITAFIMLAIAMMIGYRK